ncbi:transcription factor tau subunit [Trichophyton mentagrophytes]|nr:transcription factor tau subunit [Trichophyton mentagrophytes]
MAASLKDLIEYLLEEISLRGDQGVPPAEVLTFIDEFYALRREKNARNGVATRRIPNLDRRFKSTVWKWLTEHSEVSVGKDREGNSLTLDDVVPHSQDDNTTEAAIDPALGPAPGRRGQDVLVFVSLERTWLSITGHEPDSTRVLPLEFALLSIIASRKEKGIIQSDLVRLSGQDKRSVPKRTDLLQEKGYIEKRAIQYQAARTSLCTLNKFAGLGPGQLSYDPSSVVEPGSKSTTNKIIDFTVLREKLFEMLREYRVITRNDLKEKLGMQDRWHGKILRRAIRKFEAIGCIRRVRAVSEYSNAMKSLHPSVMLIREPTEKDIKLFHEDSKGLMSSLEQLDADLDEEQGQEIVVDPSLEGDSTNYVVDVGRIVPQWTPDRTITNLVFDTIHQSGTRGISNNDINKLTMGSFFRKPLETVLSRLTSSWQSSQPLHLRHLAILRDTALNKTVYYYIHYSFDHFSSLVSNGHASWDAVTGAPRSGKRVLNAPPANAKATLDKYGFPIDVSQPLLRKGNATLRECLEASKPSKWNLTFNDPIAISLLDGTYTVDFFRKGGLSRSALERARDAGVLESDENELFGPNVPNGAQSDDVAQSTPGYQEDMEDIAPRATKRQKVVTDPYEGLTGKELLEAQGLDEGWTEYSLLLMDRPSTGVYITPFGKRRPVGKKRGRPGKSRIAVFKSPRLKEFDWFVPQASPEPRDEETTSIIETHLQAGSGNLSMETRPCRPVRAAAQRQTYPEVDKERLEDTEQQPANNEELDTEWNLKNRQVSGKRRAPDAGGPVSTGTEETPRRRRGRPPKKRKLDTEVEASTAPSPEGSPLVDDNRSRLGQTTELLNPVPNDDIELTEAPVRETQEQELIVLSPKDAQATAPCAPTVEHPEESLPEEGSREAELKKEPICDLYGEPVAETLQTVNKSTGNSGITTELTLPDAQNTSDTSITRIDEINGTLKRDIRSGSIGVLRRKILLDILEKGGGVYPMGSEMWYPFTTQWLKTNQSTKPDARTVKNAMRTLIETGKARKHTFSGRNSKGLMVTKSILSFPEISGNHPKLRAMQKEMLDADPQLYLPLEVEIDPDLRKSNRGFLGYGVKLPDIDGEINVTLHQPPAITRRPPPKGGRRWKIHNFEGELFEFDIRELSFPFDSPPTQRLESIQRLAQGRSYLASFGLPSSSGSSSQHTRYPVPALPISSKTRYMVTPESMLMCPLQVYHSATGTFGTGAYIPGKYRVYPKHHREHNMIRPENLETILSQRGNRKFDSSKFSDPVSHQFFYDVDRIKYWEHRYPEIFEMPNDDFVYIHHTIEELPECPPLEGAIKFESDAAAIAEIEHTRRLTRQLARRSQAPEAVFARHFGSDRRQRWREGERHSETTRKLTQLQESKAAGEADKIKNHKTRRVNSLPAKVTQRLMVAMVVVRTLAGGLEGRMVEWALITPLFPDYTPKFVHDRGRLLTGRHRLQLSKMQNDFQEKFADAYERGEVPPINFDNLEAYDWEWVVDWACRNMEEPSMGRLPNLPASRRQFDSLFEIRTESSRQIDEIYHYTPPTTIPRKRTLLGNLLLSNNISDSRSPRPRAAELELLDVAKTWVRANVVTPEETYKPAEAGQIMRQFGEDLLGRAIQSLMTERVISMGNKGRVAPGRNFDLTEQFLGTLTRRRPVELTQLKQASSFKTEVLDPALLSEGCYYVKYDAADGDIITLLNLAAKGHIVLVPRDPPRNKYGLTEGGYLTRLMDKGKLRFNVEVHPAHGRYLYGNPISQALKDTPIPKGDLGNFPVSSESLTQMPKVPLWFDVHSQFVKIVWELVLSAVLGVLVARPAIAAKGITRMLEPCLAEWETLLVLGWLADVGIIERTQSLTENHSEDTGWVVGEWWWMVLGTSDNG